MSLVQNSSVVQNNARFLFDISPTNIVSTNRTHKKYTHIPGHITFVWCHIKNPNSVTCGHIVRVSGYLVHLMSSTHFEMRVATTIIPKTLVF